MSRTLNRTEDDLGLSVIDADANSYDADYFHAIHSNAWDAKSNYTLVLLRGFDSGPYNGDTTWAYSYKMGGYIWDNINATKTGAWSATSKMVRGDISFYRSSTDDQVPYLGVLKTLTMPGTLSEGSFHDYVNESWRLMNEAFKKHEAWAIARSFLQYYNLGGFSHGIVHGVVRDRYTANKNYVISGDEKQPLNNIKVTVQPGGKIYNGDNLNNGYFMIDSLSPGKYTLYFEAKDYSKDSTIITVEANKSTMVNFLMQKDTTLAPSVLSYSPLYTSGNYVSCVAPVQVTFDRPMLCSSVESEFKITPEVTGTFSWTNENRTLTFTPSLPYEKSTDYKAEIGSAAKSQYNVSLGKAVTITFTTKNKNRMNFVSSYPADSQEGLSTSLQVMLKVDGQLNNTTVIANVTLYDSKDQVVTITNISEPYISGYGYVNFNPKTNLNPNENYKIVINTGLKDAEGLPLSEPVVVRFKTAPVESYTSGNLIDSCDVIGNWKKASLSPYTTGCNATASTLLISKTIKVGGAASLRMAFSFINDSAGVCQFFNSDRPEIKNNADGQVGAWIKGDLSGNILEYWFSYNDTSLAKVAVDSITWNGWLFKKINISRIPGTGKKLLNSIVIKQVPGKNKTGAIFVDNIQSFVATDVEKDTYAATVPVEYSLKQNYPNPFNPSTNIEYNLPARSNVIVKVYNVLGREVATLVNGEMPAGNHKIVFNASDLASGIYLYKIQAGNFMAVKKLMLLK
jgi:hypothetical protein